MSDPIHLHAEARPEAPALRTPSRRWTYEELNAAVNRVHTRLDEAGVQRGHRVALHLERGGRPVLLLWALWRRGAVAVPLSTRLPSGEVGPRADRVGSAFLVTSQAEVARSTPDSITILPPKVIFSEEGGRGAKTRAVRTLSRDRPASIVFTSGSTGTPKAALHSWTNHLYSAKGANANLPLRPGDRWLLSLPLYHVGGLAILIRCALAGAAVVQPVPDASVAENLKATRATHVSLVATQFRRLLNDTTGILPMSLRAVLLGGGPIPEGLLRAGHERGWPLHTSYGSTEMASQVTTTPPGASLDELQTAGRRLPHRCVRIEEGEIQVAGAPLFRGYVTDDGIDDPRTDDGWYPTGDRGRLDASGRLHVLGRVDRMFVSGGENIQPEEVEAALERVEGVDRAVVVPVPDAEYHRRPVAFVAATTAWEASGLKRILSSSLPGFKIPDAFYRLPEKAQTESLKIDRERLRRRAREIQPDPLADEDP